MDLGKDQLLHYPGHSPQPPFERNKAHILEHFQCRGLLVYKISVSTSSSVNLNCNYAQCIFFLSCCNVALHDINDISHVFNLCSPQWFSNLHGHGACPWGNSNLRLHHHTKNRTLS